MRANGPVAAANGTTPAAAPPNHHPKLGEPTFWHEYTDTDGHLILYHCRFDPPDQKKQFRPLTWAGGRWKWGDPEGLLPLYGLPDLAAHPEKPVLLVEGEKTAEVAREIIPDFVVTTWPHGGKSTGKVDWTPLKGRDVTCWPDADSNGTGIETMEIASEQMMKIGAKSAAIVKLPEGLPDKWDLANVLPEGWSEDTVRELIEAAEPVEGRSPLGDPFGKLPAPPLPRGVLPPVIERFSLR